MVVEKGKDLAKCNIRLLKMRVNIFLLAFLLILCIPVKVFALDTQNIIFSSGHTENVIGYYTGMVPNLNVTFKTGVTSFNLVIYDKDGNCVDPSFFQGQLPVDKNLYPLTIKCNATEYESNWSIRCSIEYKPIEQALEEYTSRLDKLAELLKNLKDKLADISNTLNSMNDFLSNPKYLDDGFKDLENSVMNLTNTNPVADAGNTANMFKNGLTGTGGSASFEAFYDYMGIKINVLDFTAIKPYLGTARNIMKAMLWIEFAIFCLRIVVPKFKV